MVVNKRLKQMYFRVTGNLNHGHEMYDGPYHGGRACYVYFIGPDGLRVFDGPFHYRMSYVTRDGDVVTEEAKGRFLKDKKDGVWCFKYRSLKRRVKLTIRFYRGNINGDVIYELDELDSIPSSASKTKLKLQTTFGRLTGLVSGVMHGTPFKALLDELGMPNGQWVRELKDNVNGPWSVIETWNHGRLVEAQRHYLTYGRRETARASMSQQLNMVIDYINHDLKSMVGHGSNSELAYIHAAV